MVEVSQCVGVRVVGGGGVTVCGCEGVRVVEVSQCVGVRVVEVSQCVGVRVVGGGVTVCGCDGGWWRCHSVWV